MKPTLIDCLTHEITQKRGHLIRVVGEMSRDIDLFARRLIDDRDSAPASSPNVHTFATVLRLHAELQALEGALKLAKETV